LRVSIDVDPFLIDSTPTANILTSFQNTL
jgi:hypothetical protein